MRGYAMEGDNGFEGLAAVVTGAGSGIGLATTRALAARGTHVSALDLKPPDEAPAILPLTADVTDQASINGAVETAVEEFGGIDLLINDAGIGAIGTVEDNSDEEWHRLYDTNVVGMVRMSRAVLPHLRRSPTAAIVNVSSIVATAGLPERACYGASKGAVLALTLAMAADLVNEGIRVNCVCPGTVDTPWVGRLLSVAEDPPAARAALEARQPMGRLGTAEETAAAILFLASPSSRFVTGTALAVDGGLAGLRVPAR
jgi:NAD(P)-dependent dehydrogenase (short-subunit alcohol dehydrogenase family)